MTDTVKVLSDDEVAELQARPSTELGGYRRVLLRPRERDALCTTVRALRSDYTLVDNYVAEVKRELELPPNAHLSISLDRYKERVATRMRDRCVQKVRDKINDLSRTAIAAEQNFNERRVLNQLLTELQSLTLEQVEHEK